ncbi:hypothetical protein HJFPF1_03185 [Paramyrothecium foliicola]|nr:hypothetical protein HJFPF1_03185 [Paramyrothecium foliicola]
MRGRLDGAWIIGIVVADALAHQWGCRLLWPAFLTLLWRARWEAGEHDDGLEWKMSYSTVDGSYARFWGVCPRMEGTARFSFHIRLTALTCVVKGKSAYQNTVLNNL